MEAADVHAPNADLIATQSNRSEEMKLRALRHSSAVRANPRPAGQLSRRRLVVLLAVSAGALATLAGCGGDENLTRDNYNFPGAKKDGTGRYKSSQTL